MASEFLSTFDITDETGDFLAEIMEGGYVPPSEEARIRSVRLFAQAQDFHALIDCARSIHRSRVIDASDLEGNDLLTSVWRILQGTTEELNLNPWNETDRWIARAKYLEQEAAASLHIQYTGASFILPDNGCLPQDEKPAKRKRQPMGVTSHYWCPTAACAHPASETTASSRDENSSRNLSRSRSLDPVLSLNTGHQGWGEFEATQTAVKQTAASVRQRTHRQLSEQRKGSDSLYFTPLHPSQTKLTARRPLPGTISCIPFPPLTSSLFGLVQERFAHEPFWLLVAVTFLIRTKGTAAVPVFLALKNSFSTPEAIADVANSHDISNLIRHLGLAKNRMAILHKYARLFIDKPPQPGTVYRVRNYDSRDLDMSLVETTSSSTADLKLGEMTPKRDNEEDAEAWEIGHMTQGKYAIDSWRIFCRDELLGRAEDWKGTGRGLDFQPEWMRVMPDDKELRAYLRWMWMGEGWEWDPLTGEKTPLREEMRKAVNNGRVEYDDGGGLRIVPACGSVPPGE